MDWAERCNRRAFEFWKRNQTHIPHGFRVFFQPIEDFDAAMIGINPGGTEASRDWSEWKVRFAAGDFRLPEVHAFETEKSMALAKALARFMPEGWNHRRWLMLNMMVYRTSRQVDLKQFPKETLAEARRLSSEIAQEALAQTGVCRILFLGKGALKAYMRATQTSISPALAASTPWPGPRGRRIGGNGDQGGVTWAYINHPTGARWGTDEVREANHRLGQWAKIP